MLNEVADGIRGTKVQSMQRVNTESFQVTNYEQFRQNLKQFSVTLIENSTRLLTLKRIFL
jgi:hypothetical protein